MVPSDSPPTDFVVTEVSSLPRYTMIELPVITRELCTATSFFGGEEELRFRVRAQTQIPFRSPTSSPLSAPLLGRPERTVALLVRVVRNKKTGLTRVEVVGQVNSQYRYVDPADYQFLPSSKNILSTPPIPFALKHLADPQPLFHSEVEIVLGKVIGDDEVSSWRDDRDAIRYIPDGGTQKVKQRAKSSIQSIRFGDPIPQESLLQEVSHRRSNEGKIRSILAALESLFEIWPIITRRALSTVELFEMNKYTLNFLLPEVAFYITSSPYSNTWTRYKYDPQQHPEARYLQVVQFKISASEYQQMMSKLKNYFGKYANTIDCVNLDTMKATMKSSQATKGMLSANLMKIYIFDGVLARHISLQICDLKDEGLFDFISTLKRFPYCDSSLGWFSENSIELLRGKVIDTIHHRVNELVRIPIDDVLLVEPPAPNPDLATSPNFEWFFRYIELPDLVMSQHDWDTITREINDRTDAKERKKVQKPKRGKKSFESEGEMAGSAVQAFTLLTEEYSSESEDSMVSEDEIPIEHRDSTLVYLTEDADMTNLVLL